MATNVSSGGPCVSLCPLELQTKVCEDFTITDHTLIHLIGLFGFSKDPENYYSMGIFVKKYQVNFKRPSLNTRTVYNVVEITKAYYYLT